jgi:MGT family glycosyltransferase
MPHPLTVLFFPESAHGPTNQCIGLGDVLRRRGHRVVFAAEASWAGKLAALGFEEHLVDLAAPGPAPEPGAPEPDAGAFWTDFIAQTAPAFRTSTLEQVASFVQPTWQALVDGARYCEPRLREILAEVGPDVVVEDNVVAFPALLTAGAPYVRIVSCNPLEVPGDGVAPAFSGLPQRDRSGWATFRAEYDRTHRATWQEFAAWVVEQGAPPLPDLQFVHESEHANLYLFPAEADYTADRPLGPTWTRIDSSVRETDAEYTVPDAVAQRPEGSALVYLSLGSLGGADVELMQRLVDALATSPHRFIVSTGPRGEQISLPQNMVGAPSLPQTRVIPQVDAVITHGGNNTTTEALHFGKPMVVLPLFWDQHDNAQRVDELGLGRRLDTYGCTDTELRDAVDAVVGDVALRERLAGIGVAIRARDGLRVGADVIERVGREHADRTA